MLDRAEQVDQRAAEPINGPGHDDVEPAPAGILEQRIEAGPLLSSLSAADAGIAVDLRHVPAAVLGDLRELTDLVLNRLVVRRHPHVERRLIAFAMAGIPLNLWVQPRHLSIQKKMFLYKPDTVRIAVFLGLLLSCLMEFLNGVSLVYKSRERPSAHALAIDRS